MAPARAQAASGGSAAALQETLGVHIDPEMLVLALTHRSFAYEAGGLPTNERLEFLGDSVLGIVVTDYLYRTFPDSTEGDLARIRAGSVSQTVLADVARTIGLGPLILLGKGEKASGGSDKDSILGDTMEAIFGVIYVGHGIEKSREVILGLMLPHINNAAYQGAGMDWKTSVQELAAAVGLAHPTYVVESSGPDHNRVFSAALMLGEAKWGQGTGRNKKIAEQQAAEAAYHSLLSTYPDFAPAQGSFQIPHA